MNEPFLMKHQLLVLQDQGPVLCWWLYDPQTPVRAEVVCTPKGTYVSLDVGSEDDRPTWAGRVTLRDFVDCTNDTLLEAMTEASPPSDLLVDVRRRFAELYNENYMGEADTWVPVRRPEARFSRVVP